MPDATIHWRILDAQGAEQAKGEFPAGMTADSAREVGTVEWTAAGAGRHELRAEVRDQAGKPISENVFEFDVASQPNEPSK